MTTKFTAPVPKKVDNLLLDPKNPRIPEEKQSLSQEDLIVFVAQEYNAIGVAESIASHQYFSSEPLIAIPAKEDGHFVVVEGNRRLAALKLLLHPNLRENLPNRKEWDNIPTKNVPQEVPVVAVKTRREVAPIIGYRHISGIQPWDAYSKARYIAAQVEGGLSFKQTAVEVGEKISEVRSNYRNYRIAEQIADLGVDSEALSGMMNGFGIFTRAMQSSKLRDFIAAPSPDKVSTARRPIPSKKKDALKELVGFLFGSNAVLDDSRDLTRLGKVLSAPEGLKVLRKERNLEEAHIASGGLRDRLVGRLSDSARNLRAAKDDMPKYKKDAEVKQLLAECREAIEDLEAIQKQK
jgi:hypothetical protein